MCRKVTTLCGNHCSTRPLVLVCLHRGKHSPPDIGQFSLPHYSEGFVILGNFVRFTLALTQEECGRSGMDSRILLSLTAHFVSSFRGLGLKTNRGSRSVEGDGSVGAFAVRASKVWYITAAQTKSNENLLLCFERYHASWIEELGTD